MRIGVRLARALGVAALLTDCSSRTSENSHPTRPPENPAPLGDQLHPTAVRAAEPQRARRIENLPPAPSVGVRAVRVEELPTAPPARGRKLRGSAALEPPAPAPDLTPAPPLSGRPVRIDDLPTAAPVAKRPLRPDELTPELVRKADEALYVYNSPVGTDVPIEVNGKVYVARFAMHYHEVGGDKRPWGYHKGVTLYASE